MPGIICITYIYIYIYIYHGNSKRTITRRDKSVHLYTSVSHRSKRYKRDAVSYHVNNLIWVIISRRYLVNLLNIIDNT